MQNNGSYIIPPLAETHPVDVTREPMALVLKGYGPIYSLWERPWLFWYYLNPQSNQGHVEREEPSQIIQNKKIKIYICI